MTSALVWAATLAGAVAVVSYAATLGQPAHLALTALVCLVLAAIAVLARRRQVEQGASEPAVAATTATGMALLWAWCGVSMLVTYQLVLSWHEWWQYVLAGIGVAALCLLFASMMRKDAAAGRRDETILKIARYLTIGQLAGMVIAMIGMIIDNKMPRDPSEPDWAANAIFFFGAAALAAISADALWGRAPRRA